MKKENYKWFGLLAIPLFVVLAFALSSNKDISSADSEQGARIDGYVTVTHNGVVIKDHEHNVMTTNGLNLVRSQLTSANTQMPTNITVGSGATPGLASSALSGIITTDGLVASSACTLASTTTGNWSCHYIFTATGAQNNVNVTALYTADGTMFAGANFSSTNLAANDQLTVNWSITVS
jgi:hypothetical protein